jgi:hypothetical protein
MKWVWIILGGLVLYEVVSRRQEIANAVAGTIPTGMPGTKYGVALPFEHYTDVTPPDQKPIQVGQRGTANA